MEEPVEFYKYQFIEDGRNPEGERSIKNLLSSTVAFSTRRNFNDLFDSKIVFNKPTARQLEALRLKMTGHKRGQIEKWVSKGKLTAQGTEYFRKLRQRFDQVLDSYLFYCVSARCNSNLMWSHYANSHRGFCIAFDARKLRAEKVIYADTVPCIDLIEAWAAGQDKKAGEAMAEQIWRALKVKLAEWSYEDEYRFHLGDPVAEERAKKGERFVLKQYSPEWVKAIIFGCRADERVKAYIMENYPHEVEFRQARAGRSEILIDRLPTSVTLSTEKN